MYMTLFRFNIIASGDPMSASHIAQFYYGTTHVLFSLLLILRFAVDTPKTYYTLQNRVWLYSIVYTNMIYHNIQLRVLYSISINDVVIVFQIWIHFKILAHHHSVSVYNSFNTKIVIRINLHILPTLHFGSKLVGWYIHYF